MNKNLYIKFSLLKEAELFISWSALTALASTENTDVGPKASDEYQLFLNIWGTNTYILHMGLMSLAPKRSTHISEACLTILSHYVNIMVLITCENRRFHTMNKNYK